MIEVINRQRQRKINSESWRHFTGQALKAIGSTGRNVTIVFVSDAAIKKLNRQFRGKNQSTDVLSLAVKAEPVETDHEPSLGEVVISLQRAAEQARENQVTFQSEVKQLILHGLLHLSGYDHESDDGEMDRLELRLRKRLGIS